MIKYAIYPGFITSKNDGQEHYIDGNTLIKLYQLNRMECIILYYEDPTSASKNAKDLIQLHPRYHGDYEQHLIDKLKEKNETTS